MKRVVEAFNNFLRERVPALRLSGDEDVRGRRGRRYTWRELAATALTGMVDGLPGVRSVAEHSADFGVGARVLGAARDVGRWAIGNFLHVCPPSQLRERLHAQVRDEQRRKSLVPVHAPFGVIAFDGKEDSPALDAPVSPNVQWHEPEKGRPYGLHRALRASLISARVPMVVDSVPVRGKTNETVVFRTLFPELVERFGALFELVTGDAGFCCRENADLVHRAERAYLFGLKENQPSLLREAERVLLPEAERRAPDALDPAWERDARNRLVRRKLWVTREMEGWLDWPHLRQVILVRKEQRHPDDSVTVLEDRFFVTSMTRGRLPPERARNLIRRHWAIENEVFGTLDRKDLWAEDTTPGWPFTGNALENVSLLRCIALNLAALFRAVHLRSDENRGVSWRRLRKWISSALRAYGQMPVIAARTGARTSVA